MYNKAIKITVTLLVIVCNVFIAMNIGGEVVPDPVPEPDYASSKPEASVVSEFAPSTPHSVYDMKDKTLTELKEYNPDTVAWITIPGTTCDNVVVLGEDKTRGRDYYLNHSFDHRETTAGTLYIDYRTTFTAEKFSSNITIYGHHLLDKTMFTQIKNYRDINFYREHPYFTFETIYGEYDCQVFALYVVDLTTKEGANFDFRGPDYASDEEYATYIEAIKKRSEISCPVDIGPNDSILTLCTCTYVSNDARLMVAAKLVPKGEGGNVDVSAAYKK